jgi:RHS repeat-associated protein
VRKIASGVTTEYIYDIGGNVVAEKVGTTWTVGYVYLNGQLLAQYKNGTTRFAHKDHLGSTRLLTKPDGSYDPADVYDYLPFGESVGSTGTTTTHKFTGKERDSESGLDFFGARYYASTLGRFASPDPLPWIGWQHQGRKGEEQFLKFITNPQNLNQYTYVLNNPLNHVDPTGMLGCKVDGKDTSCSIVVVYDPETSKGTLYVIAKVEKKDEDGNVVKDEKGNVVKEDKVVLQTDVVVGGDGRVTPTGNFHAAYWKQDHKSSKYGFWADTPWSKTKLGINAFGPFQLVIKELEKKGIWIHGTIGPGWSPVTWGNSVLGSSSHGCVRVCNRDIIQLNKLMPQPAGNPIKISTNPADAPKQKD